MAVERDEAIRGRRTVVVHALDVGSALAETRREAFLDRISVAVRRDDRAFAQTAMRCVVVAAEECRDALDLIRGRSLVLEEGAGGLRERACRNATYGAGERNHLCRVSGCCGWGGAMREGGARRETRAFPLLQRKE